MNVSAKALLAIRDALAESDTEEAYHQLRLIADPNCDVYWNTRDHWSTIEAEATREDTLKRWAEEFAKEFMGGPIFPTDMRYLRATQLAAVVMQLVSAHLCEHGNRRPHKDIHEQLLRMFYDNGFDVVTDADRARAGLPPRGRQGWSPQELAALELKRLEAMTILAPLDQRPTSAPAGGKNDIPSDP